jgi:tetratricopeptide (TPR) repeat protein
MARALRLLALAVVLLATVPGVDAATDGPPWPASAEARYGEAKQLMQEGRYAEAAAAYRAVADWPDGGAFPERAQALFLAALMQENAHDYEGALDTYHQVAGRFPGTPFAAKADAGAAALAQGGQARGIDFRRRLDAAWGELFPAQDLVESDGIAAARPGLERAVTLLTALLRDHSEHPRARDVALSLGDAHMSLGLYGEARADYEQALALIRAQGPTEADAELIQGIEHKRGEAIEAGRERWITGSAHALLAAIFVGLLALRPWRAPSRWMLGPGAALFAVTIALGGAAMLLAQWIHDNVDDHSPIETTLAALLVVLPGLTGQVVAFGYTNGLANRGVRDRPAWRTGLAGMLGVVAALAVVTCLVEASGIFAALGSDF